MRIRVIKLIMPLLLMISLLVPASSYAASPDIPEFGGAAAIELNGFVPAFSPDDFTGEDYILYSELDTLGRPGPATACLSRTSRTAELRAESGAYLPVGWESVRYDDVIDGDYLYCLCHLISPTLSGSGSDARNVFTGTRFLCAEGLRPFEDLVAGFVSRTAYHFLYRATPFYRGDELVPYGVQLEAYSVEDAGQTLSLNVFLYNVQPGVMIDYRSGKSAQSPSVEVTLPAGDILRLHQYQTRPASDAPAVGSFSDLNARDNRNTTTKTTAASAANKSKTVTYILNTQTKIYHTEDCGHLPAAEYRRDFTGTPQELRSMGYYDWCDFCQENVAAKEKEKEKKASSPAVSAAGSTSQSTPASTTEKETAQSAKKSLFDLPESAIDKMAGNDLTDKLRYNDSVYEQAINGAANDDW